MKKDWKAQLKTWVTKIGSNEAGRRLVIEGLSISAAQKLLAGTYPNEPKTAMLEMIERAMK
jgi:hypothetical protein